MPREKPTPSGETTMTTSSRRSAAFQFLAVALRRRLPPRPDVRGVPPHPQVALPSARGARDRAGPSHCGTGADTPHPVPTGPPTRGRPMTEVEWLACDDDPGAMLDFLSGRTAG